MFPHKIIHFGVVYSYIKNDSWIPFIGLHDLYAYCHLLLTNCARLKLGLITRHLLEQQFHSLEQHTK